MEQEEGDDVEANDDIVEDNAHNSHGGVVETTTEGAKIALGLESSVAGRGEESPQPHREESVEGESEQERNGGADDNEVLGEDLADPHASPPNEVQREKLAAVISMIIDVSASVSCRVAAERPGE